MRTRCVECDHLLVGDEVDIPIKESLIVMTVIGWLRRP